MDVYAFKQNLKTINNSTQTERLELLNAETNRIERLDDFVGNNTLDTLVAEIGLEFSDSFYALLDAGVADVLKTGNCEIRQSEFSLNKLAAGDDLRKQNGIGFDLQQTLTELVGELQSVRSQLKQQQKLNFELQQQIKSLKAIHTNIQQPLQEVQLQIEQASTTEVSTQVHSKNAEISIATAHLQLEEPTSRKDNSKQSVHSLRQKQVGVNRIGIDTVNNSTSLVGDFGQSDAEQPVECEQLESVQEHTEQCNAIDQQRESEDVDAEQGHQLEESPPQRKEQVGVNPERKGTNDSNDDGKPHARVVKAGKSSLDRRDALKHRKRKRIGDEPKTYSCKECKKSFSFKGNLTKHLMIHNGEKPHKCQLCNKCFSQKCHLTQHLLIHNGQKPHKCQLCNKSFSFKFNLTQHLLIHNGQKPHKCPSCDKSFNAKSNLTKHLMIHNGEKPFVCDVCDTSFRQKNTLTNHMNIHAGRKPHKCNVCNKSFRKRNSLSIHLKIHQN